MTRSTENSIDVKHSIIIFKGATALYFIQRFSITLKPYCFNRFGFRKACPSLLDVGQKKSKIKLYVILTVLNQMKKRYTVSTLFILAQLNVLI